jgi:hypothetical protein
MRRLRLQGHQFDLQNLQELFGRGEPRVVQEGGESFLVSESFAAFGDDHTGLLARGEELLAQMTGAAIISTRRHRPVGLHGAIQDPEGHQHVVVRPETVVARTRVSGALSGGLLASGDPTAWNAASALSKASIDASAAAVLRLLGSRDLDWVNLYRVLDHVAEACGGEKHSRVVAAGLRDDDRDGALPRGRQQCPCQWRRRSSRSFAGRSTKSGGPHDP